MDYIFTGRIYINSGSLFWGPFSFDLSPSLPGEDYLVSLGSEVKSFLGRTDTTSQLIAPHSTTVKDSAITLRLQWPGQQYIGRHELHFNMTLASTAKHRFIFRYVHAR